MLHTLSTAAISAGSSSCRAIANAASACWRLVGAFNHPAMVFSCTTARTQVSGATFGPGVSVSDSSNHANPSRSRARAIQNGCNDDASLNAFSTSPLSRLLPYAARRFANSASVQSNRR